MHEYFLVAAVESACCILLRGCLHPHLVMGLKSNLILRVINRSVLWICSTYLTYIVVLREVVAELVYHTVVDGQWGYFHASIIAEGSQVHFS